MLPERGELTVKYLVVVDMQNDFVTGSLGNPDAVAILPALAEKIKAFNGKVIFTRDTHSPAYLSTQEGRLLPVPHCVQHSPGWEIVPELEALRDPALPVFDKPSFGSYALAAWLSAENAVSPVESVELCGVCTDICVVSNALLIKAALPEVPLYADASCCAGTSRTAHEAALTTMKMCQVIIKGEAK